MIEVYCSRESKEYKFLTSDLINYSVKVWGGSWVEIGTFEFTGSHQEFKSWIEDSGYEITGISGTGRRFNEIMLEDYGK